MGTRAIIFVEGAPHVAIYRHLDGGPDTLLPFLEEFNEDFEKERPDDPEYKAAQLLRRSYKEDVGLDDYLGWGLVDPEEARQTKGVFFYVLKSDGVDVEKVGL